MKARVRTRRKFRQKNPPSDKDLGDGESQEKDKVKQTKPEIPTEKDKKSLLKLKNLRLLNLLVRSQDPELMSRKAE